MEVSEFEKRRALNMIWNAARDYEADPGVRVYDDEGRADLYWNCIIGALWLHFDWEKLYAFYESFRTTDDQELFENLFWIAAENAAYRKEEAEGLRPVFPYLRRTYAETKLPKIRPEATGSRADLMLQGHLRHALGQPDDFRTKTDRALLEALEPGPEVDTDGLIARLDEAFRTYLMFHPVSKEEQEKRERSFHPLDFLMLFVRGSKAPKKAGPMRQLSFGLSEHTREYGTPAADQMRMRLAFTQYSGQSQENLRKYIVEYFGQPLIEGERLKKLEKDLCTGNHRECRLYFTRGESDPDQQVVGFAGQQRREARLQEARNREAFQEHAAENRVAIERLTDKIRNSMLVHLQDQEVNALSGTVRGDRIWRALTVRDPRVFRKVIRGDAGNLSVDILLDASTSQLLRAEMVAGQGYIIAESLTRCGIPVRVSAFCSMNGYTVMNLYRDYDETDRNRDIFRFFTSGANRDGLAVRTLTHMICQNTAEHRILIILSDCKPNDMIKMQSGSGDLTAYSDQAAVDDLAQEVHAARMQGITVLGVFYGNDDAIVPAARKVYGRDFIRIRSYERFAESVGTLLQNQIMTL